MATYHFKVMFGLGQKDQVKSGDGNFSLEQTLATRTLKFLKVHFYSGENSNVFDSRNGHHEIVIKYYDALQYPAIPTGFDNYRNQNQLRSSRDSHNYMMQIFQKLSSSQY